MTCGPKRPIFFHSFFHILTTGVSVGVKMSSDDRFKIYSIEEEEEGSRPPSSHATLRRVPYTAVRELFLNIKIVSSSDTSPSLSKNFFGNA